jgi:hypothetical protein
MKKHSMTTWTHRSLVLGAIALASAFAATGCVAETGSSDEGQDTAEESVAAAESSLVTYLGHEADSCSSNLSVFSSSGTWVSITRGVYTWVDVNIDADGYWYWRCGTTVERSRGSSGYVHDVKRLEVLHSTDSRDIDWWCYNVQ